MSYSAAAQSGVEFVDDLTDEEASQVVRNRSLSVLKKCLCLHISAIQICDLLYIYIHFHSLPRYWYIMN